MKQELMIYHGSKEIVEVPKFGVGKIHNDYGQGFYCTENIELAKEWACPDQINGYANKYRLSLDSLNIMNLTQGDFNILSWLAVLLLNRNFDISAPVARTAKELILSRFLPDISKVDVMIGYRADDSYFSFAEDFLNNNISLRDLNHSMQLGELGEQVVLLSERSFQQIRFIGYDIADFHEYYPKRTERDTKARNQYKNLKMNIQQLKDDIFVLDIIREDMKNDDPRLQSTLSR